MPLKNIADRFVAACSPVIDTNYDTCGTVTKATIAHLKPSDLDTMFKSGGLFADLDAWFYHSIEMKACGTRRYAWYDWIMANTDRSMYTEAYRNSVRPGAKAVKGPSLLHPFIMGRQESIVNRDYWKMVNSIRIADYAATPTAGQAVGDITDGPLASTSGGVAVIRVQNRHDIPMDANWFRDKSVIHLFTLTAGVAQQGNWRVIDAAIDTSATYIDLLVADENAASTEPYFNVATTGASSKTGVIIEGVNNVNDYEKWCQNLPNIDPRKMVPFWYQTSRNSRCVDAEYLAVFKRLMESNEAFRQFGDLDMAERNRQDELHYQKQFVNAFFFQKPISANQTLTNWESLEAINTVTEVDLKPGLGGKLQARRANYIGVKEQLRTCGRVFDLANNPLNLLEFIAENYSIAKARRSAGKKVTRIDWYTNTWLRTLIFSGFTTLYKDLYQDQVRFVVEIGKTTELGMIYDVYYYPDAGVEMAIISDEFFDDWYTEHNALSQPSVGNLLLCLDIGKPGPQGGTIYYAQLAANRRVYRTATIQELAKLDPTFRCVMETTSLEQTLMSETGTVIVECPLHSAWIQNIQLATPITTGKTVPYSDLY